jgi:alpha-glucosidase
MPLEGIWLDIPYMNKFEDFTIDTTAFPDIKNYVDMLHSFDQHVVVIVDAGLAVDDTNKYYTMA